MGLILSTFFLIPDPVYNSILVHFIIESLTPILNSIFGVIFQNFGYNNLMGNGNTFFAEFGLSNSNINYLSYTFGIIILVYCIIGIIGLYNFKKNKRSGWFMIFILSIPLIIIIFGIFFLKYLLKREIVEKFQI